MDEMAELSAAYTEENPSGDGKVKMEEPEDDEPMRTGMEDIADEWEAGEEKREAHKAKMISDMGIVLGKRKKGKRRKESSSDTDSDRKSVEQPDYLQKEKGPLVTFGRSNRPRRSVNYANIERGDEAQSQSLVTEFTSSKKKKAKKTRDELDENFDIEEEINGPKRKKPKVDYKAYYAQMRQLKEPVDVVASLKELLPPIDAERPDLDQRTIGSEMEEVISARRASGGFRRLISRISDESLKKIATFVEENFELVYTTDADRFAKSLRQCWNFSSLSFRKKWERAARMDAFESSKLMTNFGIQMSMPLSEFLLDSGNRKEGKAPTIDCCSLRPSISSMKEAVQHFLDYHDAVHFYGCDFCYTMFPTKAQFMQHGCPEFATFLLDQAVKDIKIETKTAFVFLTCTDCGLWMPMKVKGNTPKSWNYFMTALTNHSCRQLVPVVIFFPRDTACDGKSLKMSLKFLPRVGGSIPMNCKECNIDEFASIEDIDAHFKEHHPDEDKKCSRCQQSFGTSYFFKHHCLSHFNPYAFFADWLRTSATFTPPNGSKRCLHAGIDKENFIIGGFEQGFDDLMKNDKYSTEDYIGPYDEKIREKLKNCLAIVEKSRSERGTPFSVDSDDSSSSRRSKSKPSSEPGRPRADMGYEHISYVDMFSDTDRQIEVKDKLERLMGHVKLFSIGETIDEDECDEIWEMIKDIDVVENFKLAKIVHPLANDLAETFTRTVQLPLSSCYDPLKDFLLVNKIFNYCAKCKTLFTEDVGVHAKKCEVTEDSIQELFHAAESPADGIKCIDEDCDRTFCSIISFRYHCATVHDTFVIYQSTGPPSYDQSLSILLDHFEELNDDKRSRLARYTDKVVGMPVNGLYPRKKIQRAGPVQAELMQFSSENARGHKLYKEPLKDGRFDCVWCSLGFNSVAIFAKHFASCHIFICDRCGKCYGSQNKRQTHLCVRLLNDPRKMPNHALFGGCSGCTKRFRVHDIYDHMLNQHFNMVQYRPTSGEIIPSPRDLRIEAMSVEGHNRMITNFRDEDRANFIQYRPIPVHGQPFNMVKRVDTPRGAYLFDPPCRTKIHVNKSVSDLRLTCYLCEMAFSTTPELDTHLELHPEQWKKCPFCKTEVAGHYEMQKHLLHVHMKRTSSAMICQYCDTTCSTAPCAHLIYKCKRLPNCPICGENTQSRDNHVKHMLHCHGASLRRFQCSFCSQIFITMTEFQEHTCDNIQPYQSCTCNPHRVFESIPEFCDHFDNKHATKQGNSHICTLCKTHTVHTTSGLLAKHRLNHAKSVPLTLLRKVFILPRWLQPNITSMIRRPLPPLLPSPANRGGPYTSRPPIQRPPPPLPPGIVVDPADTLTSRLGAMFDAPSTSAASSGKNSVVTLDDDEEEDDDDILIDEPPVLEKNGTTSRNRMEDNVNVRVEVVDNIAGGEGQPGYVEEDDDIECVATVKSTEEVIQASNAEPVVTAIEDDNGDEEISAVAVVENAAGTLSSTIASNSREKKFKCSKCTSSFVTNASLNVHMESHRADAGQNLSSETFPVPLECMSYLCRNCSLAFEDKQQYEAHHRNHGATSNTCKTCSGIGFNDSVVLQHVKGHQKDVIRYSCGTCKLIFSTDSLLMFHLMDVHHIRLFYFCKICGFGGTEINPVVSHIACMHRESEYTTYQKLAVCPLNLLNFEPRNPEAYKMQVMNKEFPVSTPSDCSHKTLLLPNDMMISCKICHCLQPLFSFTAMNQDVEASGFTQALRSIDDGFPFRRLLSRNSLDLISSVTERRKVASSSQYAQQQHIRRPIVPGVRMLHPRSEGVPPALPGYITPQPIRRVIPKSNGVVTNRMIVPRKDGLITRPNGQIIRPVGPITRPVGPVTRPFPAMPEPPEMEINEICKYGSCKATITKKHELMKHRMHRSDTNWYCNHCGHSEKNEMGIVLHYYRVHVQNSGARRHPMYRPVVYNLRCPYKECEAEPFQSLKPFERHVRLHTDVLPHTAECCDTAFASSDRRTLHDAQHKEFESNGGDGSCCTICGTMDLWTLPKEDGMTFVLSHFIRHGMDYFSNCRICLAKFKDDVNYTQLLAHFKSTHIVKENLQREPSCQCGAKLGHSNQIFAHLKEKHMFNAVQAVPGSMGGFVINAGDLMANYLGLNDTVVHRPAHHRPDSTLNDILRAPPVPVQIRGVVDDNDVIAID